MAFKINTLNEDSSSFASWLLMVMRKIFYYLVAIAFLKQLKRVELPRMHSAFAFPYECEICIGQEFLYLAS